MGLMESSHFLSCLAVSSVRDSWCYLIKVCIHDIDAGAGCSRARPGPLRLSSWAVTWAFTRWTRLDGTVRFLMWHCQCVVCNLYQFLISTLGYDQVRESASRPLKLWVLQSGTRQRKHVAHSHMTSSRHKH